MVNVSLSRLSPRLQNLLTKQSNAAGLSRIFVLAISLIFTAISSRLIFQNYGATVFAVVTFFATLQYLIPFADLGLGAVVMNAVARSREGEWNRTAHLLSRVLRAQLTVTAIGTALVLISLLLGFTGTALAELTQNMEAQDGASAASVALVAILLTIPASVGNRILIGQGRTHTAVLISVVGPPIVCLTVLVSVAFDLPGYVLFAAWPTSALVAQLLISGVAFRGVESRIRDVLRATIKVRVRDKSEPILATSASMLVISVASPLSYNSSRLILGGFSSSSALATYSVGAQLYSPLLSIINTTATPLWPKYASNWGEFGALLRTSAKYSFLGIAAGAILAVASYPYSWFVTGDFRYIPAHLILSFALLLFVNAFTAPSMMRMNSGIAIKIQACSATLSCCVNIPASIIAVEHFGAIGAVLSTAASLFFCQTVPLLLWQYRDDRFGNRA